MAHCCCCGRGGRANKVAPSSTSGEERQAEKQASATERHSAQSLPDGDEFTVDMELEESQEIDMSSWTVSRVFKRIFHASLDSKMALNLYGNKRGVLNEQKRQDVDGSSRWMIHPCSQFR